MTTVATFFTVDLAQMAKTHLEGSGIPAFIPDEQTVSVQPLYASAIGGVRLMVAEEDAGRAREILAQPPDPTADE